MVTATGETIYPEEMEPCYVSPLFAEHCVASVRGPHGNDVPTLFVVPVQPDQTAEIEATFERLRAAAPPRLRVSRLVRLTGPLPRTASGKVQRRQLAAQPL
jgi:acyl-coenzyme A synthetase/AMP-(fatty) acid ligase